jgi:hypothetical protein
MSFSVSGSSPLFVWSRGLQLAVGGAVGAGAAGDGQRDRHWAGAIHESLHRDLALGQ